MTALNFAYADINIIASPTCEIESISKTEIKNIFMLKQKVIDGKPIKIVDRVEKPIYKEFVEEYMNKSLREMKTYWIRMLFTGKKIAPEKLSLEELNALEYKDSCYFSYVEETESMDTTQWRSVNIKEQVAHEI